MIMGESSAGRRGPTSRLSRREIIQAARRYYDLGHTQTDIGRDLGISGSYVARILQRARENGWVKIFIEDDRDAELAARLLERFPCLVHAEVVPAGSRPEDTARSIATAMATWLDDLLARDEASNEPRIQNIAIGGGLVHGQLVQQLAARANRISVGPTSLTPTAARVARFTAPMLAQQLALRFGAIAPADSLPPPIQRTGYLYYPSRVNAPVTATLSDLRRWWASLASDPDYQEMLGFWRRADVVLAGMVATSWIYDDVRARLDALGTSVDALVRAGAVAVVANQFITEDGALVPLTEGVPSYEPAIPVSAIRSAAERGRDGLVCRGYSVLDDWWERGVANAEILKSGLFNVLFCDATVANKLA